MSWYSIFYWITVADGVKDFFDAFSNIFTSLAIISLIIFIVLAFILADPDLDDEDRPSVRYWVLMLRRTFIWMTIFTIITWAGYVFCPTKRDALIIVAGGAVGKFITSDSAAKQIPTEALTLLRDKIRSEIKEVKLTDQIRDTLQSKTKEELIELLRKK